MVFCRTVQTEEALLFIGSEAALDDCILIGGALVDVEMLQAELRTLGVEAALELEAVVSLDIAQGEGELLSDVIQGQERSSLVQFG